MSIVGATTKAASAVAFLKEYIKGTFAPKLPGDHTAARTVCCSGRRGIGRVTMLGDVRFDCRQEPPLPRRGAEMTLSRKTFVAVGALVITLGLTAACSNSSTPSSPTPPDPGAPRIVSLSPGTPSSSGTAQTITVTGERFASGLTVLLDAPTGVWTTYSGAAITVQSATTFTVKVMLDKAGVWDITLHSAAGLESNEMQFSVTAG
jgi:hypothetical protein